MTFTAITSEVFKFSGKKSHEIIENMHMESSVTIQRCYAKLNDNTKNIEKTKEQCFLYDILLHSVAVLGIMLIQNI